MIYSSVKIVRGKDFFDQRMTKREKKKEGFWEEFLEEEFEKEYFKNLQKFLKTEKKEGKTIFPKEDQIFLAFHLTPFQDIKVVILGQDPYHRKNQANGLAFSVSDSQKKIPPSLKNIFKEIDQEFPESSCLQKKSVLQKQNGSLQFLAQQGVFLLNSTLTVEEKKAGSHQKKGWEIFTDRVIKKISHEKENIVFLLWGNFAQKKSLLIDEKKHFILTSSHPSPLSAYRGFFGCEHFIKTNTFLLSKNFSPIEWKQKK